jgi:shikimate kinase
MGSGKSTIGPILANAIGFTFIDLDSVIESGAAMSIGELFRREGEQGFRKRERSALLVASKNSRVVIGLGGGALTDAGSLAIVRDTGIVIYLRLPAAVLTARLKGRHGRPLLEDNSGNPLPPVELNKRITTLLASREHLYMQAEIIVDTEGCTVGVTVDRIVRKLSAFLPQ